MLASITRPHAEATKDPDSRECFDFGLSNSCSISLRVNSGLSNFIGTLSSKDIYFIFGAKNNINLIEKNEAMSLKSITICLKQIFHKLVDYFERFRAYLIFWKD